MRRWAAPWLLGVLWLLGFSSAAGAEPVRIARQFGISYLPLVLMQNLHLLEEEGRRLGISVKPEWLVFSGGPPINDAIISGTVDIATGGVGPMLTLWARTRGNLRVRALAALGCMPMGLNTNNPAVRTIRDFGPGDRIALPGVKSSIQAVVLQMAALRAWGPGQQYRLDPLTVSMGHPDGQVALLSGTEVTGHFTSAPYMYEELEQPRIRRVLDSYEVLGGPHTFNLVYATTRFVEGRPQVAAAFMAALDRAMTLVRTDPEAAAAVWVRVEKARMTPAQAAAVVRRPENEWTTTPRRVMDFMAFMADTGALNQRAERWQDLFFPSAQGMDGS